MPSLLVLAAGLVWGMVAPTSQAATLGYAPLSGATVDFPLISESSGTDPVPLYGAPIVQGDTLVFRNMDFNANSVDATPAVDLTDGQLNVIIKSDPGYFISTLSIDEFGDYLVQGTPLAPTAQAFAQITSPGMLITVLEINGVAVSPVLLPTVPVVFGPSGGDYQTGVDPSTGAWAGSGLANIAALAGSGQVTKISLNYDNQLLAASDEGGVGTISKKGLDVGIDTVVPEPMSFGLLLAAGPMLLMRRLRHQA
jgi:hypothetical protein